MSNAPPSISQPAPAAAGQRWPPLLRASVLLHGVALATPLLLPAAWPWALGALLLNHGVISAAGLLPRCRLLGPNITRLPAAAARRGEIALTFDDGPDPVLTPTVLDLLDLHRHRATFFVIARQAAAHPQLVREIVARGHSVQNHSYLHRHNFSLLGPQAVAVDLARAQTVLTALSGQTPQFFRAPAGLRNVFLQPALVQQGLQLTSWTRRGFDTRQRDPARVLARLTRSMAGGDILLLHDRHGAWTRRGRPLLLQVLPALLAVLQRAGLHSVTLPQAFAATPAATAAGGRP